MQTLTPVQTNEREIFMDVLRGFAILGIFIANLGTGFSGYNENAHLTGPYLVEGWDHKLWRSATYKKWQPFRKK
ncbi:MAG: hypothetical protein ABI666_00295 [Ferruginibacter sp.]